MLPDSLRMMTIGRYTSGLWLARRNSKRTLLRD
jgi:hypothetical protein